MDLLKYRYQDYFLGVSGSVAAGYYSKIRLIVTKVSASGRPCDDHIKLPSGKIDLVLKEGVYVEPGTPLVIRLDVDVNMNVVGWRIPQ